MKREKQTGVLIELVGIPGVGKTTLSKKMAEKFARNSSLVIKEPTNKVENFNRTIRLTYKLWLIIKFFITDFVLLFKIVSTLVKSKQNTLFDFLVVLVNLIFVISLYKEKLKKNDIRIYDQGFFQAIWAVLYSSNRNTNVKFIERIINLVFNENTRYIVIFMDIDTEKYKELPKRKDKQGRYEVDISSTGIGKTHVRAIKRMNLITQEIVKISKKKNYKLDLIRLEYREFSDIDLLIHKVKQLI